MTGVQTCALPISEELLMEKSQYLNGLAKALIEKGMLSNNEIDKLFKEIELSM